MCLADEVDDEFLGAVASIESLESVIVVSCIHFGEPGLQEVMALPRIRYLDVRGCSQIQDGWIETLTSNPRLRELRVAGTGLSQQGVEKLRHALPSVRDPGRVARDQPTRVRVIP